MIKQVEIHGFIVTQEPHNVHRIQNVTDPETRKILMQMNKGDVLSINGVGSVEVVRFDIFPNLLSSHEIREIYISTIPISS